MIREPEAELDELAAVVVEAAIEVHRHLGPGFLESVYEEALALELGWRKVPFERQIPVIVEYKKTAVGQARLDMLVANRLIVELKATESLLPIHFTQVLSYLKATRQPLALLINFNVITLKSGIRRLVRSP